MTDQEINEKNIDGTLYTGFAKVTANNFINANVFVLTTEYKCQHKQLSAKPGQFYMIQGKHSGVQFGRPISVYNCSEKLGTDDKTVTVKFMILLKGKGTVELSQLQINDEVRLIGPLGNTWEEQEMTDGPIAIIGGGIGIAPVANFASTLKPQSYDFYASFKTGSYGIDNLAPKNLIITTDDGSQGIHGMLSEAFTAETVTKNGYKTIYACGPTPMLAYIQKIAQETGVRCYLSLEKKMLCGVGACLGCTISTKAGNKRVCHDGPIFDSSIIEFEKPDPRLMGTEKVTEPDMSVTIKGVHFPNPVIAASGTFGFGQNYRPFIDVNKLGGISSKGLTLEAKPGNQGERIIEIAGGDINSIGLENPGVPHFIQHELPEMLKLKPVTIANLSGSTLETYVEGAKLLDKTDVPMIELNISCPNVKAGGMAWGIDPEQAFKCVSEVRSVTTKPLMVKLSPNAPDLIAVAKACIKAGADALSLINTIQAVAIDIETGKPYFNNIKAGMCGPAVKPIALRMVYDLCSAINKLPENEQVPVVGLGGISKWQDAVEFIMAGASAIQVGSATFSNPNTMIEIIDGLKQYMINHNYRSLNDFKGIAF